MILIIDDDASVCVSLGLLLKQAGYRSKSVQSPEAALDLVADERFDLIIQDMNFSRQTTGEEGLALLAEIKKIRPITPVILITAWGSIGLAVKGMHRGASDFIAKPWTHEQILRSVKWALELSRADKASPRGGDRADLDRRYNFTRLIGRHPAFVKVLEITARVSATDAPVLITGESGTGKELIAEALHQNSPRAKGPFVKVNLGGMSSGLFESEMFGHVRGAFTDAKTDRKGRFEMADQGAIFLDEVGDLDPACQVKLLRVLQDRTFEPLGSSQSRTVDVRVISATNRPLQDLVARGEFREDLMYRLNLIAVHLPPLRERREDIPLLANHFVQRMAHVYRKAELAIDHQALDWLKNLPWPGNIRQMKQMVERAVLITGKQLLRIEDFRAVADPAPGECGSRPPVGALTLEEMERLMIEDALKYHHGNITKVAESLGLSRAALYRRLEKFGIQT